MTISRKLSDFLLRTTAVAAIGAVGFYANDIQPANAQTPEIEEELGDEPEDEFEDEVEDEIEEAIEEEI